MIAHRGPIRWSGITFAALCAVPAGAQTSVTPASDEDIVITAERTNRTVRESASSVVVVTGKDLDRTAGAYSVDDVISRVPNLVTVKPSNNAPTVRGLDGTGPASGADAFFAGTRPRVAFQVDGRTLTFNEVTYLDGILWDTQQLEVYRGPQSTLQGRNAIGGVVAVKTADPTFQWHGKARALVGEFDTRQFSGAVGGPILTDVLAFRLSADYRDEDYFVHFPPYTARKSGVDDETREIADPSRQRSLALRGKLLVTPGPAMRALVTVSHVDAYGPQTGQVVRPFDQHIPGYPPQPRFRARTDVGIVDASADLSDTLKLSAFVTGTAFTVNRYARLNDGNALIDGAEWSAEPRLTYRSADDSLTAFVSALAFRARQNEAIDILDGHFHDTTDTNAVFGEAAYRFTPALRLTLGARYETEERDRTGGAGPFVIDFHRTFHAFLPRATLALDASKAVTIGATVGRGYNAGGAGFSFEPPFPSYQYGKESVTNYEGFLRGKLLGGRLQLNANIFYNDYRGLQLPFDINPDPVIGSYVIRNAERATTYGAEVEGRFTVERRLTLFASGGLLDTRVDRYADPTIEGNELPRSPAFTLSGGFFATPLPRLDVSVDVRLTDAYYSDIFNVARARTDTYALANAQVGYRIGPARAFVAVTNLLDATAPTDLYAGDTRADDIATISRPRKVTVGFEVGF